MILFAAFMNPNVHKLTFVNNYLRSSFSATYFELHNRSPKKIHLLNIQNSVAVPDHMDLITYKNQEYLKLKELNFSGCPLSAPSCKNIGQFLIYSGVLEVLNISSCKLQLQQTRSIIDGLNRNNTLQYFNFSSNFMSSKTYEFSIKMAKILNRHRKLCHVDIS